MQGRAGRESARLTSAQYTGLDAISDPLAAVSIPAVQPAAGRVVDALALARISRRMQAAPQAPWLHAEVSRRMADRLPVIRLQPARVLDWWSHTGGSAQELRTAYPKAQRLQLEPDAAARTAPLQRATPWWTLPRLRGAAPLPLLQAQLQPGCADLVWANMGLHRVDDPQQAFQQWHRALAVDGFLMFSTLGPGSLGTLQAIYRQAGWPPPFAPFVDMHDLGDMLLAAGFADPVMDQEQLTLTWSSAQAGLDELRQLGGNAHPARAPGLRTPRWHQLLQQLWLQTADAGGRVSLTFEIIYGHAFKAQPRAAVAATTHVALEDLRSMARRPKPWR